MTRAIFSSSVSPGDVPDAYEAVLFLGVTITEAATVVFDEFPTAAVSGYLFTSLLLPALALAFRIT